MSKVAIVTDSAANLPTELIKSHDIHVIPLKLIWHGEELRDGVDITPEEFYARLPTMNPLPTTSTFSPEDMLQVVQSLSEHHDAVVAILLASELSGSVSSARAAQQLAPSFPLHVMDSRTAAGAEGFVVLEAARVAQAGGTVEQILARAKDVVSRVHLLAVLETLEYLRRGGRVGAAVALLSSIVRIKPIVGIPPGTGAVQGLARPRTWWRGVERMVELMAEAVGDRPVHVNIGHGDRSDLAEELAQALRSRFDVRELLTSIFTPVMATHSGPVLAPCFWTEDDVAV